MIGKLRRLFRLYRLLWTEDRLTVLEDKTARLQRVIGRLQDRNERLQRRLQTSENQVTRLQNRIKGRFEHVDEQVELVKSSVDVPPEYFEEFLEWKARNPLPGQPLVSVNVATYNRAKLLTERCIPSVLGQTYDNLELIVVGDGCTDETEELVAEIDDPRLTFVNLPRDSYPEDACPPLDGSRHAPYEQGALDGPRRLRNPSGRRRRVPARTPGEARGVRRRTRLRLRVAPLLEGEQKRRLDARRGGEFRPTPGNKRGGLLPVVVYPHRIEHRRPPAR